MVSDVSACVILAVELWPNSALFLVLFRENCLLKKMSGCNVKTSGEGESRICLATVLLMAGYTCC